MEARYTAREQAATREYEKLAANVAELQSALQLQVATATANGATMPDDITRRISFTAAGRTQSAP